MAEYFQQREFNEYADKFLDCMHTAIIVVLCVMLWDDFEGWLVGMALSLGSIFVAGFVAAAYLDLRKTRP